MIFIIIPKAIIFKVTALTDSGGGREIKVE
jgi:hypothetical protein